MLVLVCLLFLNLINTVHLKELDELDSTCQNLYTYGYGYRLFYNLPPSSFKHGSIMFNFSVLAPSNAHVLLSEKPNAYPGYEVVIGAGGNEFSEIRKYRIHKLEPKSTLITKNILSIQEIKNFSITIKDSIVSVYFMNNTIWTLILSWEDATPLDVKYLSFCSWTGVTVRWYYDCKGVSAVAKNTSPLQKLKKILLKNYDPYSVPPTDINKLIIDAAIELQYISLDAKKSLLTTHGKFYFTWYDPRIKWNPEEHDNITSMVLLHREVWIPDFVLFNSQDRGSSPMENAIIKVVNNGTVNWSPEAKLITRCALDLSNWPFDEHNCNISLGLHSHPEYVHVSLSPKNVKTSLILKDLEWKITSLIGETTTIVNPWEYNNTKPSDIPSAFLLNIGLKRQFQLYVYSFIFPLAISVVIILASFWLPIFDSQRLNLYIASVFILLLNLMALDSALPVLPTSTPYLLSVNGDLLILTVIQLIICAYTISKVEVYDSYVPKFIERIVTHPVIQSVFCLFIDLQYHNMKEESQGIDENVKQRNDKWILFSIILDRISFFTTILYIAIILIL